MTKDQILYGYFDNSLNAEELKLFKEYFVADPDFAEQVRMQANMLASLRGSASMSLNVKSANRRGLKNLFRGYRLFIAIPIIIVVIIFLGLMFLNEEINSDKADYSGNDSTINWMQSKSVIQIDSSVLATNSTLMFVEIESVDGINENENDSEIRDTISIPTATTIDNSSFSKAHLPEKKIDSCKLFKTYYGKNGSRIKISLSALSPYKPSQLFVQLKELFTIEDFLNSDFINTSSEDASLAIQRMLFVSVVSNEENNTVTPKLLCDQGIHISIPLLAGYKDMTVMQMKSHEDASNYMQQIVKQNDSLFCVFNSNYFSGYNLGKPIKPKGTDFKIRAGEIFWQPQLINCFLKNEKEDFIVTGRRDHKDTYSYPGQYNKRKTWVYMKIRTKGIDYILKVRLSECSYYPKTNFYQISKELFERKAKVM